MPKISPIVSVIIPTYNRENLVSQAIQSVLNQTYRDFEVIVVDDASIDNTQKIVNNFNDSRIRYICHKQNAGVSVARNTGIATARGEYIAFLDSDDEWFCDKLAKQMRLFQESSPEVGLIYSWCRIVSDRTKVKSIRSPGYRGFLRENLIYANLIGTPSTVIAKREAFDKGVRFDPSLRCCEDWDVWLQLAKHYHFDFVAEPLVQYREHDEANRGSTNSKSIIEGYLIFLQKYHQQTIDFFRQHGNFPEHQKARLLFNIGRRLICHNNYIEDTATFNIGKNYLGLAVQLNPLNIYFLFYYLVSLFGNNLYFNLNKTENKIRGFTSKSILIKKHKT